MKNNLIKNWTIVEASDGNIVIEGYLYNDKKKRWNDGSHIRTSALQSVNFKTGVVITLNTKYNLEKKENKWQD
ncbi:MAG: hypothetical protein WCR33_06295 [Bacilli bacterium]